MKLFGIEHTKDICQRCYEVAHELRREMLMPMPANCPPLSHVTGEPCCFDCAAADGLVAHTPKQKRDKQWWVMMRIAIGNDRQEKLRLPGLPGHVTGYPSVRGTLEGDLKRLHKWQDTLPSYLGCDVGREGYDG